MQNWSRQCLFQDTPKSQGSFGDGIGDGEGEGKDEAGLSKSAKDERDKLPPYLPSVHGCRSVEEFHVSHSSSRQDYESIHKSCPNPPSYLLKSLKFLNNWIYM